MTPQWKDAPDWANYLAQDENGKWYWFSDRPVPNGAQWVHSFSDGKHRLAYVGDANDQWLFTMEARPAFAERLAAFNEEVRHVAQREADGERGQSV